MCSNFFGDEGFHEHEGKPYCRADFYNMFAPKCAGCLKPILANYISAMNVQWHPECFVCRVSVCAWVIDLTSFHMVTLTCANRSALRHSQMGASLNWTDNPIVKPTTISYVVHCAQDARNPSLVTEFFESLSAIVGSVSCA